MFEIRTVEFDHIDLDSLQANSIDQTGYKIVWVPSLMKGSIDQVDSEHPDRFLLEAIFTVQHSHMQNDIVVSPLRFQLKTETHPTVAFIGLLVVEGGNRVGKGKKMGF